MSFLLLYFLQQSLSVHILLLTFFLAPPSLYLYASTSFHTPAFLMLGQQILLILYMGRGTRINASDLPILLGFFSGTFHWHMAELSVCPQLDVVPLRASLMNFKVLIYMCYPPYFVGWKRETVRWQKAVQCSTNTQKGAHTTNAQHQTCVYALVDTDWCESGI